MSFKVGGEVGFFDGGRVVGFGVVSSTNVISTILMVVAATAAVVAGVVPAVDDESLVLDGSRQHIKYPVTGVSDIPHDGSS